MTRYANLGGDSGVSSFEIGHDSISVTFRDGSTYLYNYQSPGRSDVEHMKTLARRGEGLNAYINRHVKKRYAAKTR